MRKSYQAVVLSLALLAPAVSRAQSNGEPFVQVTLSAASTGYFHVKAGVCHTRPIVRHDFLYSISVDFSGSMSGSTPSVPAWCTAIYPDFPVALYEEWNGDVAELCGERGINVQVVDDANWGGQDISHTWTGPACLLMQLASMTRSSPSVSRPRGSGMTIEPARLLRAASGIWRNG